MKKYLLFLGRTEVFFFALLWLMVLLVIGTIAQKDIGLYWAQQIYFSSFFFMSGGFLPMPAGYSVMMVIFVSLIIKLLTQTWRMKQLGTLVIHIAALMLLLGGFLTAISSYEGNMVIKEGEIANYISDYHAVELAFVETTNPNHDTVTVFPQALLQPSTVLRNEKLPFTAEVQAFYRNADMVIQQGKPALVKRENETEDEQNTSGIVLKVDGKDYVVGEFMPVAPQLEMADKTYRIQLRHKRTYLPFEVKLLDFETENHPNSSLAKTYTSEVVLQDDGVNWHSIVAMNEPLRYKGYTLFQASFIEEEGAETTVLAVVKNLGRMFPYIASIAMCTGLLIHLFQRIPPLLGRRK
jgi:cytochrome c biogenesis protein ResB